MSSPTIAAEFEIVSSTGKPLSTNVHLLRWVRKMAALCKPDRIHWIDGSQEEYDQLCEELVSKGTLIRLNQEKWPGCFLARSDPGMWRAWRIVLLSAAPRKKGQDQPIIGLIRSR